jgi:hypothetical protein
MSDSLDSKSIGLLLLGVLATFSAYQVYNLSKKLEEQNEKLFKLAI